MEEGFLLEKGHRDSLSSEIWVAGKPDENSFFGMSLKGKTAYDVKPFVAWHAVTSTPMHCGSDERGSPTQRLQQDGAWDFHRAICYAGLTGRNRPRNRH
jgi:hypothetical protein